MKTKKENPIGFRLVKVTTEQFALFPEFFDKNNEKISMGLNLNFGVDKDKRLIKASFKVQFEQNEKPFLVLETANQYQIEEQSWQAFIKDKEIVIPKNLATHLAMLTVGTLRGVLHAKTENTEFNQLLLPTIDITQMLKDDVIFNHTNKKNE